LMSEENAIRVIEGQPEVAAIEIPHEAGRDRWGWQRKLFGLIKLLTWNCQSWLGGGLWLALVCVYWSFDFISYKKASRFSVPVGSGTAADSGLTSCLFSCWEEEGSSPTTTPQSILSASC